MSEWKPDAMNWRWVLAVEFDPSRLACLLVGIGVGLAVGALVASIWIGLGFLALLCLYVAGECAVRVRDRYIRERSRLRRCRERRATP